MLKEIQTGIHFVHRTGVERSCFRSRNRPTHVEYYYSLLLFCINNNLFIIFNIQMVT